MTKEIGSLLDILPKPNTPEWSAMPVFVRVEVEQLRRGERPMSRAAVSEAEIVPRRIDLLANEIRNIGEQITDSRIRQQKFDERITAMLGDIREGMKQMGARLDGHDDQLDATRKRFEAVDKRFEQHGSKLLTHETHITGVFKRLDVLETARATKPRKRKTRKKAKRP